MRRAGPALTHWNSVLCALGCGPDGIDLPASAQRFVNGDEAGGSAGFALGQLGLDGELRALGIEHREEIVHAAVVTLAGQRHGLDRRMLGCPQIIAADLLASEINQGVLGFLERVQDGLFVGGQLGVGAGVDGLDAGQDMAEIQGGPGDAWAKGIGVGAALEKAGDFAGLKAEVAVESDAREEVRTPKRWMECLTAASSGGMEASVDSSWARARAVSSSVERPALDFATATSRVSRSLSALPRATANWCWAPRSSK